jgi:sec-independent protein translocase protein TatB
MFGVDSTEFLVVAVVALLVIGPKDLPHVLRKVGHWVGRARGVARHFRTGIDTMIRESELDEMEKRWREENDRVMREHPVGDVYATPPADPAVLPAAIAEPPTGLPGEEKQA